MIYGNFENKYESSFFVSKLLVKYFIRNFVNLLPDSNFKNIADIGAGEGYLTTILARKYSQSTIYASDISSKLLDKLKAKNKFRNVIFERANVKKLKYKNNYFDLIILCEVLEHINNPNIALKEIYRVANKYVLISVPNEPVWRVLNILRFKYLKRLGNTPGHINHYSKKTILKLLRAEKFKIIKVKTTLPWIIILMKK